MDKITDSDSVDMGSIPVEATTSWTFFSSNPNTQKGNVFLRCLFYKKQKSKINTL